MKHLQASPHFSRRSFLRSGGAAAAAMGFGGHAFARMGPKPELVPHFAPRAKNVIMIFLSGGVSHVDSFDPKPDLDKLEGKYLPSPWEASRKGKNGTLTTDLFPEVSNCIDDITLIRSMHGDHNNHTAATLGMHTGSVTSPRPSLGSWISYALGTSNPNLPGHIVLSKEPSYAGSLAWDSNFLPANHQGVHARPGVEPIRNLKPIRGATQPALLNMLAGLNASHADTRPDNDLLARQQSFETAASMELAAPTIFDFARESQATKELYGLTNSATETFAWQCLAARRLVESGVRFVELFDTGSHNNWDGAHGNILSHQPLANAIDRPIAGLLKDLKQRGLLDETLVIWCSEFGRTPRAEGSKGRNHHSKAFTTWLAGGGTKRGYVHGATDESGSKVIEGHVHTHDFHATILHALGLDHKRLTYRHNGRDFRLTDVAGNVAHEVFA
ncbi:DUF1501 domain-containing protein [Roseibacillus persicicus]|uniref:DUF1501 domain-containing protein n=1 Tax=Roseibacillus persicicus TaxID=454148 RepID=UPI00398B9059